MCKQVKYAFYVVGINYRTGAEKGAMCPSNDGCPRGTPNFCSNVEEGDRFREWGFIQLDGTQKPQVMGILPFSSQDEALKWFEDKLDPAGTAFKRQYKNLYLLRVMA